MSLFYYASVFFSGLMNGLFGAGGGILLVKALKDKGLAQKNAQATALMLTLIMSVISCGIYAYKGYFRIEDALIFLPFGIIGAISGAKLLKITPDRILKKIFALFIIWAGARMLIK